jgi:hypothetical protein
MFCAHCSGRIDLPVAPALQGAADALGKAIVADNLKKDLSNRSEKDELVHNNILKNTNIASSLQPTAAVLEKNIVADHLKQNLASTSAPGHSPK